MYLNVLHEKMRGHTRCYGNDQTGNVIVLLVFAGKRDHAKVNIRSVVVIFRLNTPLFFFIYISYDKLKFT